MVREISDPRRACRRRGFRGRSDRRAADFGPAGELANFPKKSGKPEIRISGFRQRLLGGSSRRRVAALFDVAAGRFGGLSGQNRSPKFGGPDVNPFGATLSQIGRFRVGRRSADVAKTSRKFGNPETCGPRGVGNSAAPPCSTSLSAVRESASAKNGVRNPGWSRASLGRGSWSEQFKNRPISGR